MANHIYFLLPVYNESKSIYDLCEIIHSFEKDFSLNCDVILINDASKDDTVQWIKKAQTAFPDLSLIYIEHNTNKGLQGALNTGLNALRTRLKQGDIVVTMDGDNTHPPYLVREMIQKHKEGADIVIASRYLEQSRIKGLPWWRKLLSLGAKWLYCFFWHIPGVKDYTCLFRSHKAECIQKLLDTYKEEMILKQKSFACTTEFLAKLSQYRPLITEVPMLLNYGNKFSASNSQIFRTIFTSLKIMLHKN